MPPEQATSDSSSDTEEKSYLDSGSDVKVESAEATTAPGEEKPSEKPESALDVVQKAMGSMEAGESPAPDGEEKVTDGKPADGEKPAADTEAKAGEESVDDKELPFHTHPRFKELTAQNREMKQQLEQYQSGDISERAQNYEQLSQYMGQNNLNADDFNNGLAIMAAMKNDPVKALEMIQPYYDALSHLSGKVLPDDIQLKLDDGHIDEDTAYALATERARNRTLSSRLQRTEQQTQEQVQRQQQEQQTRQATETLNAMKQSVSEWENAWSSSDPDYAKLMPYVRDRYAIASMQNRPTTPDEAVKMVEKIQAEVKKEFGAFMSPKEPMQHISSQNRQQRGNLKPEPESGLEVVQNALRG